MKRFFALVLILILVMPWIAACSDATVESCHLYVSHVDDKGLAGQIDGMGSVYIYYKNASSSIHVNDYVTVSYRSDRITQEKGIIHFRSGQTFSCDWIIEKVDTLTVQ